MEYFYGKPGLVGIEKQPGSGNHCYNRDSREGQMDEWESWMSEN